MDLPEGIKVAGIDVVVVDWDHGEADTFGAYGIFCKNENMIKIDTSKDHRRVTEVFIHEMLHAIWAGYYLQDSDDEERIVSTLASGLTQVFRDNPDVVEFIQDQLGD